MHDQQRRTAHQPVFEIQHIEIKDLGQTRVLNGTSTMLSVFEDEGFIIQDPTNEPYSDSRTGARANISGALGSK